MTKLVVEAPTLEEAIVKACEKLDVPQERIHYCVLREPRAGWFGLFGRRTALIEAERISDPVEEAADFLQQLIRQLGWDAEVHISSDPDGGEEKWFILSGENLGGLIGKNGQTLHALQTLCQAVLWKKGGQSYIVVEADGYRMKKRKQLIALAERVCQTVIQTGQEKALPPMTSQERKWIHQWVQKQSGLSTTSIGEEPQRRVVIKKAP